MQGCDRRHQRQAEPRTLGMAAGIEAIEPPEDVGALRHRDTLPGIGHLGHDAPIFHEEPGCDRRSGRRVDDGVLHQVGEELREQFPVAVHYDARCVVGEIDVLGILSHRGIGLMDAVHQFAEIDLREAPAPDPTFERADPQQRLKGREDTRRLFKGVVDHRRFDLGAVLHLLKPLVQTAERRAQIMRDVVRNLPQGLHRRRVAIKHPIQVPREFVEFRA